MNYINFEMASLPDTSLLYPLKEFYRGVKKLGKVVSVVVVHNKNMTVFAITEASNLSTSIVDLETFINTLEFKSINVKVHIENDFYYILLSPSDRVIEMNFQKDFIEDYAKTNVDMVISKIKNNMVQKTLEHKSISDDDYKIKQLTEKHIQELRKTIDNLNDLTNNVMKSDDILFNTLTNLSRKHITVCKNPFGQFEFDNGRWYYTSYDIDACDKAFYTKVINTYGKMNVLPIMMTFDQMSSVLVYK